jgi:predicted RNase H-like nuclease
VAGLDGCRAGWVLATAPVEALGRRGRSGRRVRGGGNADGAPVEVEVRVVPDLTLLVEAVAVGAIVAASIDIPIGLPARGPRRCDVAARRLLGPRRSSVFPAPARSVLAAGSYAEACARSRRASGKGISKQLYNILPKIREVDAALAATPGLTEHVCEMCPELSLAMIAGAPMAHAKRTPEGRDERRTALRAVFGDVGALTCRPPRGAAPDDVLDAIAGLWTAHRYASGTATCLGGEAGKPAPHDETGLRMEVVA